MAVLDTLIEAYAEYSANFDLNESVRATSGAAMLGFDNANNAAVRMFSPEQLAAKKNLATTIKLPAIERGGITVRTSRAALPLTPTLGDTVFYSLVFNVHEVEFSVVAEEFRGNAIGKEQYIMKKIMEADKELMNAIDLEAVTAIDAAKAQLTNSKTPYAFTAGEFVIPSAAANTSEEQNLNDWINFLIYADSIVTADGHMDADGALVFLSSPNGKAFMKHAAKYGMANQFNLEPLMNGINSYVSSNIAEGTGAPIERSNGYLMLPKSFETHTFLSGTATEGYFDGNKEVRIDNSPTLGQDVEFFYEKNLKDMSALNAKYTRTEVETFMRTIETAQLVAYNSDPATYPDRVYKTSFVVGA